MSEAKTPTGIVLFVEVPAHQLKDCPEKRPEVTADNTTYLLEVFPAYHLNLKLMVKMEEERQEFMAKAVVDAGSPVSLIKHSLIPVAAMQSYTEDDPVCEGINKSLLRYLGKIIFDVRLLVIIIFV